MWSSQTTQPKMARRYKYFIWAAYHGKNASFPFGSLEKENINLAMHGSSKIKCPFHSCGRNWVARKLSLDPTKKCYQSSPLPSLYVKHPNVIYCKVGRFFFPNGESSYLMQVYFMSRPESLCRGFGNLFLAECTFCISNLKVYV